MLYVGFGLFGWALGFDGYDCEPRKDVCSQHDDIDPEGRRVTLSLAAAAAAAAAEGWRLGVGVLCTLSIRC